MTNRIIRISRTAGSAAVWLLAILGASMPALSASSLTPHSAEYRVEISILRGKLTTELGRTETGYAATHMIKATGMSRLVAGGSIIESSQFDIANESFRPTKYSSHDTLTRDKGKTEINFNWEKGEARGTVDVEEIRAELDQLAFDRVSIQYELMHDLLNGSLNSEYTLFDVDEMNTVQVKRIGNKRVNVPAGNFEAIGIQHQSTNSSRVTTLWCVEELGFLPVIIEQRRNGKLGVRATLTEYLPN